MSMSTHTHAACGSPSSEEAWGRVRNPQTFVQPTYGGPAAPGSKGSGLVHEQKAVLRPHFSESNLTDLS